MKPFHLAFHHATAHGLIAAVNIPDAPDPVPEEVLATLPLAESEFAKTLKGYRQVQFVGGRIAAREAAKQLRIDLPPMLSDARGAPICPDEICVSVSHKKTLALAMVCLKGDFTLGVDLECYGPQRMGIAKKVLTPEELIENQNIECRDRQWIDIPCGFPLKSVFTKHSTPLCVAMSVSSPSSTRPRWNRNSETPIKKWEGFLGDGSMNGTAIS